MDSLQDQLDQIKLSFTDFDLGYMFYSVLKSAITETDFNFKAAFVKSNKDWYKEDVEAIKDSKKYKLKDSI